MKAPVQPTTVGTFSSFGCMTEATASRALTGASYADDEMTLESCASFCANYTYFGTEYARECYCGNAFETGAVAASAGDCSMTCGGDFGELCGGSSLLSAYVKA